MKNIFLVFLLLVSVNALAQKTNRHTPIYQKGFYLSLNPHSPLEPEQGAVGLGLGYRIDKRFEVCAEVSYLYEGIASENEFKNLQGYRGILSGKYFYKNKYGFFVGAEFRIKQYSFSSRQTFVNIQTNDTLTNYPYKPQHTLIGGAIFWGKRFKLSANGKFEMEGNIGIGVKHRYINRKNVPAGYSKMENFPPDRTIFLPNNDREEDLPYFPATFRFIYHL